MHQKLGKKDIAGVPSALDCVRATAQVLDADKERAGGRWHAIRSTGTGRTADALPATSPFDAGPDNACIMVESEAGPARRQHAHARMHVGRRYRHSQSNQEQIAWVGTRFFGATTAKIRQFARRRTDSLRASTQRLESSQHVLSSGSQGRLSMSIDCSEAAAEPRLSIGTWPSRCETDRQMIHQHEKAIILGIKLKVRYLAACILALSPSVSATSRCEATRPGRDADAVFLAAVEYEFRRHGCPLVSHRVIPPRNSAPYRGSTGTDMITKNGGELCWGDAWNAESLPGGWRARSGGQAQHLHPSGCCSLRVLLSALEQSVEAIGESPEIVGCLRTR
ncbi:hypothetical protein CCMA1212_006330 [Trichoderma ghanense]|uniref:Uncharacterized protein n=1 Tax=Trichoderma ghanense TaxID=65468 RepID=A0ABY2H113_9HYPO